MEPDAPRPEPKRPSPKLLYRVEYVVGLGYPEVYKRERTKRTYESAEDAGRMVDTIRRRPDHFTLVGIWRTRTAWRPVQPDALPVPVPVASVPDYEEADPNA